MTRIVTLLLALLLLGGAAFAEETAVEAEETGLLWEEEVVEAVEEELTLAIEETEPLWEETEAAEEEMLLLPEQTEEAVEAVEAWEEAAAPITAVTGIAAQPVDTNAARITWDKMDGAAGYQLWWSEDGENFTWTKNCTTNVVNKYVLTPGADYWFQVRPWQEEDGVKRFGPFSEAVRVHILGKIENFTVTGKDTNCAFLKWDRVPGCTGYQVFRTVAGSGEYQWVKNATTAQVANYALTPGTTYYYKVRAYVDLPDGKRAYGQYSPGVMLHVMEQAQLTAVSFDGAMQLSWSGIYGVTGYQVFYLEGGTGGVYSWVGNTKAGVLKFTHAKPAMDADCYYRVRAYIDNADGTRAYGQFSEASHCVAKLRDFAYHKDSWDDYVVITGCAEGVTKAVIPAAVCGYPVTRIDAGAFEDHATLTEVVLPASMKDILWGAFRNCAKLQRIVLPDSVEQLGNNVFENCTSLRTAVLSKKLARIGEETFSGCTALTQVTIPDGIREIGWNAFKGCVKLQAVTLPDSMETISGGIFQNCTSLQTAVLSGHMTLIPDSTFEGCTALASVTIPEGIREIGWSAFQGCAKLQSVSLPGSLTKIGPYAFQDCAGLQKLVLPAALENAGYQAFCGCASLKSVTVRGDTVFEYGAFRLCPQLRELVAAQGVTQLHLLEKSVFGYDTVMGADWTVDVADSVIVITGEPAPALRMIVDAGSYGETYALDHGIYCIIRGTTPTQRTGARTVQEKVSEIVANVIRPGMNDYQKAIALHNWLTANANYDTDYKIHAPSGVLLQGKGVCQSYAEAYQLLLNAVGIQNKLAYGNNHVWNMAKIGGSWCHIDVTWDDPIGPDGPGGFEGYTYFCVTDFALEGVSSHEDYGWGGSCKTYRASYAYRNGVLAARIEEWKPTFSQHIGKGENQFTASFDMLDGINDRMAIEMLRSEGLELDGKHYAMTVTYRDTSDGSGSFDLIVTLK